MLEEIKVVKITVLLEYIIAMNVLLEYLNINIRKFSIKTHNIES